MTKIQVVYDGPIVNRADAKASGLTQYFTGMPCKNGHIDQRWTCSARCKTCQRASSDSHYAKNKDKYMEYAKERGRRNWHENKDVLKERNKSWRENNKEYNRHRMSIYRKENPEYFMDYDRKYRRTPIGKMVNHIRNSMKRVLRGSPDSYGTRKLGYTSNDLKYHIESQFKPGMSWDNYGEWEIDHKIPIKWYFDNGIQDPKVVNSLDNLQPLWKSENRSKGAKLMDDII